MVADHGVLIIILSKTSNQICTEELIDCNSQIVTHLFDRYRGSIMRSANGIAHYCLYNNTADGNCKCRTTHYKSIINESRMPVYY